MLGGEVISSTLLNELEIFFKMLRPVGLWFDLKF